MSEKYTVERYQKYKLYAPADFWETLRENPLAIEETCNGVGSELSVTYHFTPDTVWFQSIREAADIHDWMYTFPVTFPYEENGEIFKDGESYRLHADRVLVNNMIRIFNYHDARSWWSRRTRFLRDIRTKEYYALLRWKGGDSFWYNKNRPETLGLVDTNKIHNIKE